MLIQLLTPYKYYPLVRNQCIIKQNTQSSKHTSIEVKQKYNNHENNNNNIHVQHHKLSLKTTHVTNYIQNVILFSLPPIHIENALKFFWLTQ